MPTILSPTRPDHLATRPSRGLSSLAEVPRVGYRAGLDLHPLDPADGDDRRWLVAQLWPEHDERRARLVAALSAAAGSPPRIVAGDAVAKLAGLVDDAPADQPVCIFHSHMLNQMDAEERRSLLAEIGEIAGRRRRAGYGEVMQISLETPGVTHHLPAGLDLGDVHRPPWALLALTRFGANGGDELLALCGSHGEWADRFEPAAVPIAAAS